MVVVNVRRHPGCVVCRRRMLRERRDIRGRGSTPSATATPSCRRRMFQVAGYEHPNVLAARALGTLSALERDGLPFVQIVEAGFAARGVVEEVSFPSLARMKPKPLSLTSRLIVPFIGAIAISLKSIDIAIHALAGEWSIWPDACPEAGRRWIERRLAECGATLIIPLISPFYETVIASGREYGLGGPDTSRNRRPQSTTLAGLLFVRSDMARKRRPHDRQRRRARERRNVGRGRPNRRSRQAGPDDTDARAIARPGPALRARVGSLGPLAEAVPAAEGLVVELQMHDVAGKLVQDPEAVFTFRQLSGNRQIADQDRRVLSGAPAAFSIPAQASDVVFCELDLLRYRFARSDVFFRTPGPLVHRASTLFREPLEWRPAFTLWQELPAAFSDLKTVLDDSPNVVLQKSNAPLGKLVGAAYDSMTSDEAVLAKTALLNAHHRLHTIQEPVSRARSWFSFVRRIITIDRERFVGFVQDDMEIIVRHVHDHIGDFRPDYERAPAEHHRGNVPPAQGPDRQHGEHQVFPCAGELPAHPHTSQEPGRNAPRRRHRRERTAGRPSLRHAETHVLRGHTSSRHP